MSLLDPTRLNHLILTSRSDSYLTNLPLDHSLSQPLFYYLFCTKSNTNFVLLYLFSWCIPGAYFKTFDHQGKIKSSSIYRKRIIHQKTTISILFNSSQFENLWTPTYCTYIGKKFQIFAPFRNSIFSISAHTYIRVRLIIRLNFPHPQD